MTDYNQMGTTALGKLVAERTGMPCNSRNKPALVRKLEKMDAAAGTIGVYTSHGVALIAPDGTVTDMESPAPAKASDPENYKPVVRALKKFDKAAGKLRAHAVKVKRERAARVIHSDPALHAPALSYVRRAMARKQPPSLRALCAEMNAKGIKTPWGRKTWWPASVQNLLRQIAKEVA